MEETLTSLYLVLTGGREIWIEELKEMIIKILNITLEDTVKARLQRLDGGYKRVEDKEEKNLESQKRLYELAVQRIKGLEQKEVMELFQSKTSDDKYCIN